MKSSLLIVGCFVVGCLIGRCNLLPDGVLSSVNSHSEYVLYLLMFLVGLSVGSDKKLREILRSITPKFFLIPLATIIGTIAGTVIVSFFISRWSMAQCLSVGCGFAYYSLSSILITQFETARIGVQAASELGTIALIANVMRELFVLLSTPFLVRYFGRLSPICAGGATTMDTTLPIITRYAGKDIVFISILHAVLIDFSVPLLVSFFCSL